MTVVISFERNAEKSIYQLAILSLFYLINYYMVPFNKFVSNHRYAFIRHQSYHHLAILNETIQNDICSTKGYPSNLL